MRDESVAETRPSSSSTFKTKIDPCLNNVRVLLGNFVNVKN